MLVRGLRVARAGASSRFFSIGSDQVSISMVAAPVNSIDLRKGAKGSEGLGCVTSVGSSVNNLAVGDWVLPKLGFGSFCKEAVVDSKSVTKVANDIPVSHAASLSGDAATAYRLLKDFGVAPGEWIIQSNATSSIGMAVIQIAREMGIKTINVIDSELPDSDTRLRLLSELGGDMNVTDLYVHSYGMNSALNGQTVKMAIAGCGGDVVTNMSRVLSAGGKMVTYDTAVDSKSFVIPTEKKVENKHFSISEWYNNCNPIDKATMFGDLAGMIREDKLSLFIQEHDFDDFDYALQQAQDPFSFRKVVLRMDHPNRFAEHDARSEEEYAVFNTTTV